MPTLNWIGKEAVIRHHKNVPLCLLEPVPELSHGEDSGNLLVQGDNLDALKALLPQYAGNAIRRRPCWLARPLVWGGKFMNYSRSQSSRVHGLR